MRLSKILKTIKEEEELLPNQSSKKDLEMIRKLKALYLAGDEEGFKEVLDRLNRVRRSEGLDNLTPNEIVSRTIKKDITKKQKSSKPEKIKEEKPNKVFPNEPFLDKEGKNYKKAKGIFGDIVDNKIDVYHNLSLQRIKLEGKEVIFLYSIKDIDDNKDILSIKSPYKYKLKDDEIRFPELGKKVVVRQGMIPKIKKL